jgi:hypothetical protein
MMKSTRMRLAWHVARVVRRRMHTEFWTGKSEGNRPLGKPRRRWEDNIKIDLIEIGWGGIDWIHLTQDKEQWWALVNMLMTLRVS